MPIDSVLPLVIGISLLSLGVAWVLARAGPGRGHRHARDARRSRTPSGRGPRPSSRRQYRTIGVLSIVAAAAIFGFYFFNRDVPNIEEMGEGTFWKVTISFLIGALCSAIAGYIGMFVSIRANIRTAAAAMTSLNKALQIALRGGRRLRPGGGGDEPPRRGRALLALRRDAATTSTCRCRSSASASAPASWRSSPSSAAASTRRPPTWAPTSWARSRPGIPEDDPRNPAVIADLVGDNVGDCAGRGADLFESTAAENIGAMILGIALYPVFGLGGILFPLLARAFGLIATIIGVYTREGAARTRTR